MRMALVIGEHIIGSLSPKQLQVKWDTYVAKKMMPITTAS